MNPSVTPNSLEFAIDLSDQNRTRLIKMIQAWVSILGLEAGNTGILGFELSISPRGWHALDPVVISIEANDGKRLLKLSRRSSQPVCDELVRTLATEIPKSLGFFGDLENGKVSIPKIEVGMSTKAVSNILGQPAAIIKEPLSYTWIYVHPAGPYRLQVQNDIIVGLYDDPWNI